MKIIHRPAIILTVLFLLSGNKLAFSQAARLNTFIDCNCDMNYIRQELTYINYVRDQALADVQLFVNDVSNGGGGRTYQLNFSGRNEFEGIEKELTYETSPTMTGAEVQAGLTRKINQGMLTYLAQSSLAGRIKIVLDEDAEAEQSPPPTEEAWNNWIFEVYGSGSLNKETSRSSFDAEFGLDGDRVTEEWRIRINVEYNHFELRFQDNEEEFTSMRERHYAQGSVVKSLGDHWSTGVFSGVSHNTYSNLKASFYFQPAIEYNLFPYREVIRREITFAYKVGYIYNDYILETIYAKMEEELFNHSLNLQMRFRQPWGDISTSLVASSYLHDLSKNRVQLDSYISVRLVKGLAARLSTDLELVRDQLNLPSGDASLEDILLRQRQIATDFEVGLGVGLSYTFGSPFNNIVNTRL